MRRSRGLPAAVPALLVALLFALQLWCFRWGVIMPDTVDQYHQLRVGQFEDWHPPVTAWLWGQLGCFGGGTAPVLAFHCALYWLGLWLVAERFRRLGQLIACMLVLLIGLLPIPFGQMGAILKDPLLAACLLAASGLLATGALGDGRIHWLARVAAVALLVLGAATRFNAVFAAAPLLVLALGPVRSAGRAGAAVIGAVVLLAGTSWAINAVALHPKHNSPIISLVQFDIAGIAVRSGTGVYPADMRPDAAIVARCYEPAEYNRANADDCNGLGDDLLDHIRSTPHGLETIWLGAIVRHPLAWAEHRLAHWNWNQRWLVRSVPNDAVYVMSQPNDLGLTFQEGTGARTVAHAAGIMAESPFGRPATWTAVALALLIVARHLRSGPLVAALSGSALLYALAYLPVSVAPDLRYNLWTMLAAMIGLVIAIWELPKTALARRDALLAAAPVVVVIAGELVAMA